MSKLTTNDHEGSWSVSFIDHLLHERTNSELITNGNARGMWRDK